ncbi:MAG: hypothetical protein LJE94_07210 [Deltaproteobacteria bacterium]|nr:hypothetical protein [Deltaproteobacteria bacterium]
MEKQSGMFRGANFKTLLLLLGMVSLVIAGCGGGGGGGGVDTDEVFDGGSGTGADGVAIFWKYFGGIGNGNAVEQTTDGGFVFAGEKGSDYSFETKNACLLKSDSLGNLVWSRSFGGDQGQTARDVKQCSDGGFIVVGYTDAGASRDVYVIRTDPAGNPIWSRTYDRQGEDAEGHAVCVVSDNEYAIAGSRGYDVWFFKIDDDGDYIPGTDRFYASAEPSWCRAYDMEMTGEEGFVMTGRGGPNMIGVILTEKDGDVVWNHTYGTGIGYAVKQAQPPDDGFIVAGSTTPFDSDGSDVLVIKIDDNGDERWRRTFGGSGMDVGRSIVTTPDGGYLIAGVTESFSQSDRTYLRDDVYLIKLTSDGEVQWQKVKGQSPDNSELANAVRGTADGGYVVTGSSQSQIMLAKFDRNGDTVKLGELDFSFTVPETIGTIQLTNAREVAETVVSTVMTPIRTGTTGTALFIGALKGDDPADFCDGGGTYAWSPAPANQDGTYALSFADCAGSDMGATYTGGFDFTIQIASGDMSGSAYEMNAEITSISVTATDDVGESVISGGMLFASTLQSGTLSMTAENTGSPLTIADDESTKSIAPFGISSTRSEGTGGYTIGQPGETVTVQPDYLSGPLRITFQQALSGTGDQSPDSGALLIEAQDGSRLTMTVLNGIVDLAVDTDGDGNDDGTISSSWDDLS